MNLSIIIPSYNAASWLPKTLLRLQSAIDAADIKKYEIIIVDDGSTDDTKRVVAALSKKYKIKLIAQSNQGRYIARKAGINAATFSDILLIDTRVFISKNSLKYLVSQKKNHPDRKVWNAHVHVDKKGNSFARFWDAIVQIAWRKYFSRPREVSYGLDDFDRFPKGTTCFYAPKQILLDSMKVFESQNTAVSKTTNDDTLIIREIAAHERINLSPDFSCLYHARTDLRQFLKHSYHRGQVFADGFLRPGNLFFIPLLGFLSVSLLGLLVAVVRPELILYLVVLAGVLLFIELLAALILLRDKRDALSLVALTPIFAFVYGLGIWKKALISHKAYVFASLLYTLLLAYNYGRAAIKPGQSLISGPFDHTVLMWFDFASPSTPWWQFSNVTNFPSGEHIWNPIYITGQLIYIPYWLLARLTNSIAAYNILVGLGLVLSALITFAFLRWLLKTNSFWVPFLGGWAAIFTPYLIIKTAVHPSYAAAGIVVIALWLVLLYLSDARKKWIIWLAVLTGLSFYYDVYFVLFCGVVLLTAVFAVVLKNLCHKKTIVSREQIGHVLLLVLICGIMIAPLFAVRYFQADRFNAWLGDARTDKWSEAQAYGARPQEYLLPSVYNPLTPQKVIDYKVQNLHGSSLRESNLSVSLFMSALAFFSLILLFRKRSRLELDTRLVSGAYVTGGLLIVAGLLSLAPKFNLAGFTVYLPGYVVTMFTEGTWRVMARLALVVHIAIAILGSIGLFYILRKYSAKKAIYVGIIALSVIAVFADTMNFKPGERYTWDLEQTPTVYNTIRDSKNIQAIAEYPMVDPPRNFHFIYYDAYQLKHKKPMVNSNVLGDSNDLFRSSITDITNGWQSAPTLIAMGVQAVVIHDISDPGFITGLTFLGSSYDIAANNTAWLYSVNPTVVPIPCVVIPSTGFDGPASYGYKNIEYFMHQRGTLNLVNVPSKQLCTGKKQVKVEFYTFEKQARQVTIKQRDKVVWQGLSNGYELKQSIELTVDSALPIEIIPTDPPKDFSLVVSNMITKN